MIPILDPNSLIYIPYPRVNCLKTIPFTATHTYIAHIWQYPPPRDIFEPHILAYCPHVSGESGHRKRIFSKTLSEMEKKNAGRQLVYVRMDVRYDDLINQFTSYTSSITHAL